MPDFMSDVFTNTPQRRVEVTNMVNEIIPVPTLLGGLGEGLFRTVRVSTRVIAIQRLGRQNRLIPVSPIGAPPVELEVEGGDVRPFFLRRLAKGSTVYAEELQGVTDFFNFTNVRTLDNEVAQRSARIRDDFEFTNEYQRFGALQGMTIDADGTTVLDNWFTHWGVPAPTPFDFNLSTTRDQHPADHRQRHHHHAAGIGRWLDYRPHARACADRRRLLHQADQPPERTPRRTSTRRTPGS